MPTQTPTETPVQPLPKPSGGVPFVLVVWLVLSLLISVPWLWAARSGSVWVTAGPQPAASQADTAQLDTSQADAAPVESQPDPSLGSGWADGSATSNPPAPAATTIRVPAPAPSTSSSTHASVTATVARTCGADGNDDCFLTLRAGPDSSTASLLRYDEGETVQVTCQVYGDRARSSVMDATSSVWAKTTDGGYVAAIYLDGIDQFSITTPC